MLGLDLIVYFVHIENSIVLLPLSKKTQTPACYVPPTNTIKKTLHKVFLFIYPNSSTKICITSYSLIIKRLLHFKYYLIYLLIKIIQIINRGIVRGRRA